MISATKRRWDEVHSLYRERDEVEKKFDELKNELDILPLRVHKIETLQGLLFIFFVSLVIRAMVLQKARNVELLDKNAIEEILLELAKRRAVKVGGKWRLTEISKNRERYSKRWGSESRLRQTWLLKRAEFRMIAGLIKLQKIRGAAFAKSTGMGSIALVHLRLHSFLSLRLKFTV